MSERPLILASASPRRRQLLELIGLPIEIMPSAIDERPAPDERPSGFARRTARDKAADVASANPGRLVLGADTVVELDGAILGKPTSRADAAAMLRSLSGREHLVHTAVALAAGDAEHLLIDTAAVRFAELTEATIDWYAASSEPMDKAGAYAIQGLGGLLVVEVNGSPHTVVGLPIHRLPEAFAALGLDFWSRLVPR